MGRSAPRTMVAPMPWLLLLCLAAAATGGGVFQSRAQPDSEGFISIDCGYPGETYVDSETEAKLQFAPDAGFTDSGSNHNISVEYMSKPALSKNLYNVRSFPDGVRNCYMVHSLVSGLKYLIRAIFMYGNYDSLNRPPMFDLYVGVNFWTTVNMSWVAPDMWMQAEAIVVVPDDYVHVCLVNSGAGTPFISSLELRPLMNKLYPQANRTQGLVLFARRNLGATDSTRVIRYPYDPHDRLWRPLDALHKHIKITTSESVMSSIDDPFQVPTEVMHTAITAQDASKNIGLLSKAVPQTNNPSPLYIGILHFAELRILRSNAVCQFYINLNGELWHPDAYRPTYLYSGATYDTFFPDSRNAINISIEATASSTLPPILNAFEIFSVMPTTNVGTDSQDVSAITAIKEKYQVHKNWMGDPCIPKSMAWDGLTCSYAISSPPRITSVDLSDSGLNGDISSIFAHLKAVQYLDLSNNNLKGSIPSELLKRVQDGSLNLRYENNPGICTGGSSCKKSKLVIYIVAPIAVIVVLVSVAVLIFCLLRRRKQGSI